MTTTPLLNRATVDALIELGRGSGFFNELLDDFTAQTENLLAQIESAIATQNATALRFAVHTLKGSSFNIGAHRLGELCAAMERLSGETDGGGGTKSDQMLQAIRESYIATIAALQECAAET